MQKYWICYVQGYIKEVGCWGVRWAWVNVNNTNLSKWSHFSESTIENQSIFYTSDLLWSEEDINIDLGLDTFGVNFEVL